MKICYWNVINSENQVIKVIKTSKPDRKIAFEKLKFLFPNTYYFVRLELDKITQNSDINICENCLVILENKGFNGLINHLEKDNISCMAKINCVKKAKFRINCDYITKEITPCLK